MLIDFESTFQSREAEAIELLCRLSAQNSGSYNLDGLSATQQLITELFEPFSSVTASPLSPFRVIDEDGSEQHVELGELIDIRSHFQEGPETLLVSHYDTVFGVNHRFQKPLRSGDRLVGPGVADAKGGIIALWLALSELTSAGVPVRWRLLIVPDEEIGSPGSAPMLRSAARDASAGYGFEPSMPDGSMAAVRPGSGTFTVRVSGVAAHAGRSLNDGRNAVVAAGEILAAIEALNTHPDVLANPAFIRGGGPTNIVPDFCLIRFNVRPTTNQSRDWALQSIQTAVAAVAEREGYSAELIGGFNRAPKPMTPAYRALLDHVSTTGASLGLAISSADTGGVCDGNVLFEAGLVNVDNLGPIGGNLHADGEYIEIHTLVERARLASALLQSPESIQKDV